MTNSSVDSILQRPYRRVLVPDPESGVVTATIPEFPGCVAEGDSASEALSNLERTAREWVQSLLTRGVDVPEPSGDRDFSGRFPLRLPISLHEHVAQLAERDGVSLNTFIVTVLAEHVGLRRREDSLRQTLEHLMGPRVVLMQDMGSWGSMVSVDEWQAEASTASLPPGLPISGDYSVRGVLHRKEV